MIDVTKNITGISQWQRDVNKVNFRSSVGIIKFRRPQLLSNVSLLKVWEQLAETLSAISNGISPNRIKILKYRFDRVKTPNGIAKASPKHNHSELEEIGTMIAKRLRGLPLAAKLVGSLLKVKLELR